MLRRRPPGRVRSSRKSVKLQVRSIDIDGLVSYARHTALTLQSIYPGTLRTELAYFKEQLTAEQRGRDKDRQRAEQAEAAAEVLKQQLTAFQEQLNRMRKAERAKDEEYRRLQDERSSLARAQEETKASVMKMWDQLEKKDREVNALQSRMMQLGLHYGGQPGMQGGPPVPQGGMRGLPPGMPPPGQMNGYPNRPGMMQQYMHMQPQSMPRPQVNVRHEARTACTWLTNSMHVPLARAYTCNPLSLLLADAA
jgi:flagellar biosynthesis GTPase FlhF